MTIEETIFKMTESANELFSYGEFGSSKRLFLLIDKICENNEVPMPDEAVSLNIALDEHFGRDILKDRGSNR
jgi:hypothetical protein